MFLAQIVFSFRSLCLKAVVTDFVLPGTRGEEERGDGGLSMRIQMDFNRYSANFTEMKI